MRKLRRPTVGHTNDWVFDFCSGAPTRLVPVAHIPMADVDEAIKEMKRTAALGAKAMMMGSDCEPGRPYGHPYFDPLWEEAVALDMPMTIHPAHRAQFGLGGGLP